MTGLQGRQEQARFPRQVGALRTIRVVHRRRYLLFIALGQSAGERRKDLHPDRSSLRRNVLNLSDALRRPANMAAVDNQIGRRVFRILHTDGFWSDGEKMKAGRMPPKHPAPLNGPAPAP